MPLLQLNPTFLPGGDIDSLVDAGGIRYSLAKSDCVTIAIHDVSGRLVRTLGGLDGAAGEHVVRWDGRDEASSISPSGLYFARLQGAEGVRVARLTVIR